MIYLRVIVPVPSTWSDEVCLGAVLRAMWNMVRLRIHLPTSRSTRAPIQIPRKKLCQAICKLSDCT